MQGTLEGAVKGAVVLLDDKNQRWQVAFAPGATIHVTGTATPEFLHSGLVVEFQAEIDNHGVAQAKVEELKVTSSGKDKTLGLFPAGKAGDEAGDFGGQGSELGGNAGAAAKHPKHAAGRRQSPRRQLPHRRHPDGRPHRQTLGPRRPHQRPVQIGRRAEDFHRHGRLQPCPQRGQGLDQGDGAAEPAGRALVALASEVKVELAEPLTGPKKKKPEAKPRHPKPDEGLPEPAGDK